MRDGGESCGRLSVCAIAGSFHNGGFSTGGRGSVAVAVGNSYT